MPSYYSPGLDDKLDFLTLDKDESHHLLHVLRQNPGDIVQLNSGSGWLGSGKLHSIEKSLAIIEVTESFFVKPPLPAYAIAFSLLRNKNDAWLVEKTTELGVADLFPIITRNTVRNPSQNTQARFQTTALSAIKQCDNPYLPVIHPLMTLPQFLDVVSQVGYKPVIASEKIPDIWLDNLSHGENTCFIIGPEGGFDIKEFELCAKLKIPSVTISSRILRAETAAVAIAAQFNLLRKC